MLSQAPVKRLSMQDSQNWCKGSQKKQVFFFLGSWSPSPGSERGRNLPQGTRFEGAGSPGGLGR